MTLENILNAEDSGDEYYDENNEHLLTDLSINYPVSLWGNQTKMEISTEWSKINKYNGYKICN